MSEPGFTRYIIPQTTIDGPALYAGTEAALKILATVHDEQFPLTLSIRDWAGPWTEPHNPVPNPLEGAVRELRELRAKWAARGVHIAGVNVNNGEDSAIVVEYSGRGTFIFPEEAPRLVGPGDKA